MNNKNVNHEKTKKKIKIIGFILVGLGAILTIIGFVGFFASMANGASSIGLFAFTFVGLPMLAIGAMLLLFGYKRELYNYNVDETSAVTNKHVQMLKPSLDTIADSFNENKDDYVICNSCGEKNSKNAKFCKKCGAVIKMKCPHCGEEIDSDSEFCSHCGSKVK